MSEQNEVVIRKVHDGYLVELLDCPLAYTFSSQDEAERFIGPVWQRLDYVKDLHSQALRAENARLKEALQGMLQLVDADVLVRNTANDHAVGWGTQALLIVQALQQANEALQPKEPKHD